LDVQASKEKKASTEEVLDQEMAAEKMSKTYFQELKTATNEVPADRAFLISKLSKDDAIRTLTHQDLLTPSERRDLIETFDVRQVRIALVLA
jgi:hypothetical protein